MFRITTCKNRYMEIRVWRMTTNKKRYMEIPMYLVTITRLSKVNGNFHVPCDYWKQVQWKFPCTL